MSDPTWNQTDAIAFARLLETVAPAFGCHICLTGGCLYRDGERKDCDILIYRIRQAESIDLGGLLSKFSEMGMIIYRGFGFCYKCEWDGKPVDLLIPEEIGNDYQDSGDFEPVAEFLMEEPKP